MSTPTLELPEDTFVNTNDYNKLKVRFEQLKSKNQKLTIKNKDLSRIVEEMMKNYKTIEESKNNSDEMLKYLQESIKNLQQPTHKPEYSTTTSQIEIKSSTNINKIHETNSTNLIIMKKLEEMELNYNEMVKNFVNTVKKYKTIKDDYDLISIDNTKLLQQIKMINNEYGRITIELDERQMMIDRFKEIDKCIVDLSLNTMVLNTNEHKRSNNKDDKVNSSRSVPYISCEPIPSFLKFLNKTYIV